MKNFLQKFYTNLFPKTNGVARSTFLINPDGKIAHAWNNVKVKGHVEAVPEKLKEIKSL